MMENTSIIDTKEIARLLTFSWLDYLVFVAMLAVSGSIGIFFGCFGTKQNSSGEYLLADKNLGVLPVAMSIFASTTTGMALLGVPADVYKYGAAHIWSTISSIIACLACIYMYMPVFFKLELITTYQYLLIRFDNSIKNLASCLYSFQLLLYNPVVIFLPCFAFSQVTGYNIDIIAPAATAFCVFYTAIGGLKTVVWTDTIQIVAMTMGSTAIFVIGLYQSGDVAKIFEIAETGERLNVFNFDLDPTIRDNFWTYVLGYATLWMVDVSISQSTLQRFNALPTYNKAKTVILIYCLASVILKVITVLTGVAIYAKYAHCDLLQSGKVVHMDQVVAYFVMDVGGSIPGLPGLFISGIFAAALSSLSTNLLNLATVIYNDFLQSFLPKSLSEKTISYVLKLIVVVVGILDCCLVFLVGRFGGIMQFGLSLLGITYGTLLGLFTLGMVFPLANKQGALWGGIVGLTFNCSMVFGNLWYKYKGVLPDYSKPVSIDGCNSTILQASTSHNPLSNEIPWGFFRISFWYYTLYGCIVVLVVGLLISWITRKNYPKVRSEFISPMFQFLLSDEQLQRTASYRSVNDHSVPLTAMQRQLKQ